MQTIETPKLLTTDITSPLLIPDTFIQGIKFPQVITTPAYMAGNDGEMIPVPGHKAIKDAATERPFKIVTDRYQVIPYQQTLSLVEEALNYCPEFGTPVRKIDLLDDGGKMRVQYQFPDVKVDIGQGDMVNPTLDIHTSYDTGWSWWMDMGAYRWVCSNGMFVGKRVCFFKHKHTTGLNPQIICNKLKGSLDRFSDEMDVWKKWADRLLTPTEYEQTLGAMSTNGGFGKKAVEAIGEEVEAGSGVRVNDPKCRTLTVFLFWNIVTQFITHQLGSVQRKAEMSARARDAFNRFRN